MMTKGPQLTAHVQKADLPKMAAKKKHKMIRRMIILQKKQMAMIVKKKHGRFKVTFIFKK